MSDLFKNTYELQKQQLMNVVEPSSLNFSNISATLNNLNKASINNSIIDSENERLKKKE